MFQAAHDDTAPTVEGRHNALVIERPWHVDASVGFAIVCRGRRGLALHPAFGQSGGAVAIPAAAMGEMNRRQSAQAALTQMRGVRPSCKVVSEDSQ